MKNICSVIALAALLANATEISIGGNVGARLVTDRNIVEAGQRTETRTTEFQLRLIPSVIISPQSNLEIVPQAGFLVRNGHRTTETAGNEADDDWTHIGFGAGIGLLFRLVEANPLRFSLGPDAWYWLYNPEGGDNGTHEISAGMPVNLDFLLTQNFFIRASARVAVISYSRNSINDNRFEDSITWFDIQSLWTPTLGFYWTF